MGLISGLVASPEPEATPEPEVTHGTEPWVRP